MKTRKIIKKQLKIINNQKKDIDDLYLLIRSYESYIIDLKTLNTTNDCASILLAQRETDDDTI